MSRSFLPLLLALVTASFCLTSCVAPSTPGRGVLNRGPYLQQATSTSVVVVWRTQGPIDPVVRFGPKPGELTQSLRGEAITLRVSSDVNAAASVPRLYKEPPEEVENREADHDPSTPPNTYQYEAHISGLQPG